MAGLKTSEIRGAYSALRNKFLSIADTARLRVTDSHRGVGFDVRSDASGAAHVEARLYLQNWPWRANSNKKNLDILVSVNENFATGSTKVIASSTRVSYFSVKNAKATCVLEIHYDFEDPVPQAHPVFHAQLGGVTWRPNELAELGFTHRIRKNQLIEFNNSRIPTPFMGYGPILLALAADHLDYHHYSSFLKEIRGNASVHWGTSCDTLQKSLEKHGGYLHSYHWY